MIRPTQKVALISLALMVSREGLTLLFNNKTAHWTIVIPIVVMLLTLFLLAPTFSPPDQPEHSSSSPVLLDPHGAPLKNRRINYSWCFLMLNQTLIVAWGCIGIAHSLTLH
jgi:hypothetical protein